MDIERIRPLKDWMLVEVLERKTEEGGIILPEASHKLSNIAVVLKTGPGRKVGKVFQPVNIKVGEKVYIRNLARCEVVSNDEKRNLFMVAEPFVEYILEDDSDGRVSTSD